ncbi:hypothetical protein [Variovorax paradoxus]|uniref:hypothetical protein n=1 Tax=Variovorax paradoxus TaxID=34073 RepID=UPI003ECF93A6
MTASLITEPVVERQESSRIVQAVTLSRPPSKTAVKSEIARIDASELATPLQTSQVIIEQTTSVRPADDQSQLDENKSSADFDGSDYIPRSQLTKPPSALAAIVLNAPEGKFGAERYVGVLSLFIDEEGHVKHVAAEGVKLPPMLEQVARETFIAAPFSPGQVAARNVKSRVRIEVVFDNRFE